MKFPLPIQVATLRLLSIFVSLSVPTSRVDFSIVDLSGFNGRVAVRVREALRASYPTTAHHHSGRLTRPL